MNEAFPVKPKSVGPVPPDRPDPQDPGNNTYEHADFQIYIHVSDTPKP